jgi:hypothetical protein
LVRADIWGPTTHIDPLFEYFLRNLGDMVLYDIEPIKFSPTWKNVRVGEDIFAKIINMFLITSDFIDD